MSDSPTFEQYQAALIEHGDHLVRVEMNVLQLTMLLYSLQLALRHPQYPDTMRAWVEPFVEGALDNLERISPTIAATWAAGNDWTHAILEEAP